MKRGFLILSLLWVLIATLTACQHSDSDTGNLLDTINQRGYVTVGVKYDSPPFGFLDADNTLKGIDIDLAHELARQLLGSANAVRFVQVNTSTRVAALNARQVDFVLATMTITPARAKIVNFTTPYYQAAQGILVRNKSFYQSLNDLQHARILYVIGGTGQANLQRSLPTAQLLGFNSTAEAFTAFQAGRGDAFSQDDSILYGFLHRYCGLRMLQQRISVELYGIAFRKDPASEALHDKIQVMLTNSLINGFLKQRIAYWNKPYPPANCH